MRYFSLFSGIGGFENGFPNEWECVGHSEINRYAAAIYRYHFPEHRSYGDATGIVSTEIPEFDMLVAGFPCQSYSNAGKRRGFKDDRGALFFEIARILRDKRPRYLLLENVKGLFSFDTGKGFQTILGILSDIGYRVQWQVLNSKDFGIPQHRERVFIVGHFGGEPRPEIFPLQNCTREVSDSISDLSASAQAGGRVKIIQRPQGKMAGGKLLNLAPTLRQMSQTNTAVVQSALYHGGGSGWEIRADLPVLRQTGGISHAIKGNGGHLLKNWSACAKADRDETRFRRLTPLECERLQGFRDYFTAYGIDEGGKRIAISDTQRYKVLGNAVTVNVIRAIAEKFRSARAKRRQ